jgi:hypothetical protein
MALTIRACPQKANTRTACNFEGFDLPDVVREVHRVRVVGLMHAEGFAIVVDSEVRGSAEGFLDAGRCTTTASEAVDDQATENMVEIFRSEKIVVSIVIH